METFLKVLDPEDASTGGGSASAIAGAMAGSLAAMVARLSLDLQADEQGRAVCERIYSQAGRLSLELNAGSQADAWAFQSVRSAYQLPRQTDDEKSARQKALQAAWLEAARVPLENAGRCLQICELSAELSPLANPRALSDLHCAQLLARAGLLGCLENVRINLPAIKDPGLAAGLAEQADRLDQRLALLEAGTAQN